jgi:hypothetical protein
MRIAYLDCFSGISGDMFLGAAVDAGVPLEKLQSVAAALGLDASLTAHRVQRSGISATKIEVVIHGHLDQPLDLGDPSTSSQASHHEHSHEHSHDNAHSHSHEPSHSHDNSPAPAHVHRGLPEIRQIIARAPISAVAQAFALNTFQLLAQAEGTVHNQSPESIHFHEVGSEDAIVDIVCSAVAIELLAADAWYCSALNVGGGTVRCAHGVLPVPAPATAELLRGAPVFSSGAQKELLTPTGAAILKALNVRFEPLPAMTLSATGYGAGARELPGIANVVRLTVGNTTGGLFSATGGPHPPSFGECGEHSTLDSGEHSDTVVVLEANIDDMNPQLFSYVQQKLLTAGALDAFAVPVQMKKGRPGLIFTVLAALAHAEAMSHILLTETTTLGVRMLTEQRRTLQREHVTVASQWGPIRVKLGIMQGQVVNSAPEFEDCRKVAEATGVPLKTVMQEALRLAAGSAALPDPAPAVPASIPAAPKSSKH